jgi:hypothetical protein
VGRAPTRRASARRAGIRTTDAAGTWDTPTWQSLDFAIADPHTYGYRYTPAGTGTTAQSTAGAHGNLDGDDVQSTFERAGALNAQLEMYGSPGIYMTNDERAQVIDSLHGRDGDAAIRGPLRLVSGGVLESARPTVSANRIEGNQVQR